MWAAATSRKLAGGAKRPSRFRAFLGNNSGATAVEFALVAAPFIALLVALLQTALVFFAQRALDEITEEASRYLLTGQAQIANTTQGQFRTHVCTGDTTLTKLVSALFTCNNLQINVQSYSTFAAASTADPVTSFDSNGNPLDAQGHALTLAWSPGNPGDVVVLQIMYLWPVVGGPLGFSLVTPNSNGARLLMSNAVFRNEPY